MLRINQLSGFGVGSSAAAIAGVVTAGAGSYALTGTVASVRPSSAAKTLTVAAGSYALTGTAASPLYSGDYAAAFLARTSGLDGRHVTAYTNLINGLVTDGVWSKLDLLHVYATQDSTTALLNLVSTSYTGTANGSPTFTADRGFTGTDSSTTKYIDTGFNPSTASSPKYVRNDAHLSVWQLNNVASTGAPFGATEGADVFTDFVNSALIQTKSAPLGNYQVYRINTLHNQSVYGVIRSNSDGHWLGARTSSSASSGYYNGGSAEAGGNASQTVPNKNLYALAVNTSGGALGAPAQVAIVSVGSGLTSGQATSFYNRLLAYMTATSDPYWTNVKLLLGFDGTNGATSGAAYTDESSAAHGTYSFYNNSPISTAQFVFGVSSLSKGTGSYVIYADSADWSFSTGNFTVECWIRPSGVSGTQWIVGKDNGGSAWSFYLSNTSLVFKIGATTVLTGGTIAANTWYAVCVDFDGTTYRLYVDGVMVNSSTSLVTVGTGGGFLYVGDDSGSAVFQGYLDELRITKGTARYASGSGYTVTTTAFPRS